MPSVVIVNQHTNNYGDDAAGVALVHAVREHLDPTELDVYYIWHGENARGLPVGDGVRHHFVSDLAGVCDRRSALALTVAARVLARRINRPELAELVHRCRAADLVLVSPAGSNLGIYKDWMYVLVLLLLVLDGVRPVFMQNTIGPSNSAIFDRVAGYVLRRSDLSVRELASQRWLASKGLSAYLGVDTALLDPPAEPSTTSGYLAVVPTGLAGWHRDFRGQDDGDVRGRLVAGVVATAGRRGLPVVLVPHLYGPSAEGSMLEGLASDLRMAGCDASIAPVETLADYRQTLAGAQAVVSMRYHGLIVAAQHGVPCVALAYENKMTEASAYLGLGPLELDVARFTADELRDRIDLALDQQDAFAAQLRAAAPSWRLIAAGPLLSAQAALLRDQGGDRS